MKRDRNLIFAFLFAGALLLALGSVFFYFLASSFISRDIAFGDAVGVVDLFGEITYDLDKIKEIDSLEHSGHVKAVVLHINSPGGGVAGTQELYHSIKRLREKKPVVACMGAVAASGGYYIACAADSIVAHEGTITGSIGVIATFLNTQDLFKKVGLGVTVIKTGKYKDVGSPYRKMSDEEKQYIGGLLDNVYRQFVRAVSEGRGMSEDEVEALAEGRIFSGEEAFKNGLIDRIGTYQDALRMASTMAGIKGEPKVVKKRRRRRNILEKLFGKGAGDIAFLRGESRVGLKYIIP